MMGKIKILIVDDIFSNRLLLSSTIESLGHDFQTVNDGRKAIEAILNSHFDLVLMDIEMPVMNGIETTIYIRKNLPEPIRNIPIIGLTAHNPLEFPESLENAGFNEMITKPYSIEKFIRIINKYVIKN